MNGMNILLSVVTGMGAFLMCLGVLYTVSPIDGLLKLLLFSAASYFLSMYVALYVGNKKFEIKAIGWGEFYEPTGA